MYKNFPLFKGGGYITKEGFMIVFWIILGIAAYFLGAIPFGYLYSRLRGVDITKVGSKNIGSTNVSRQFGFLGGFVPVFILDFMKGAIPVVVVRMLSVPGKVSVLEMDLAMLAVGMIAIIGHMFPIYLKFKGGKGVATAAGVFMLITPIQALLCVGVFVFVLFLARALALRGIQKKEPFLKDLQKGVGISSVIAAAAFPISVALLESHRLAVLIVAILLAVLLIYRHKSNIAKLIKGETW